MQVDAAVSLSEANDAGWGNRQEFYILVIGTVSYRCNLTLDKIMIKNNYNVDEFWKGERWSI